METEFKGTQGNWVINKQYEMDNGNICLPIDCDVNEICTLQSGLEFDNEEIANANLIASSPELLEACISALHELQLLIPGVDISVIDRLESAINKALGKQ